MPFAVGAACAIAAAAACISNDFADGQFACDRDGSSACPEGLACGADGLCHAAGAATDGGPPVDAGLAADGESDDDVVAADAQDDVAVRTGAASLVANDVACPPGASQEDVVENATALPSACVCGACTVTSPPDCMQGSFTAHTNPASGRLACNTGTRTLAVADGGCVTVSPAVSVGSGCQVDPAPAVGGTCTAPVTVLDGAITATHERLCIGASGTCVALAGDVACPNGMPTRHLVGASAQITCSACSCTVRATCIATLSFGIDNQCSAGEWSCPVDGGCQGSVQGDYSSYAYYAAPGSSSCTATPANDGPHIALTGTRTVCCP